MKNNIIIAFTFLFLLVGIKNMKAQEKYVPVTIDVVDGDTIYVHTLEPVVIFQFRKKPNRKKRRLIRNIKKAYPYAKLAGERLYHYNTLLKDIPEKSQRDAFMKQAEKELKAEFTKDLEKLTFSQGRILLKLIDRETGNSSYDLVHELRGSFSAAFWQTFARVFGFNLKDKYDPYGEDKKIEDIVQLIEKGYI